MAFKFSGCNREKESLKQGERLGGTIEKERQKSVEGKSMIQEGAKGCRVSKKESKQGLI